MTPCPLFIELCAGTAAMSLRLHRARARPPVSRMGAKTGYADVLLGLMGLAPGQGTRDGTRYLWCEPDPGVRLLLEAYRDAGLARAAADIIRGWAGEDPRALWERLRAEGAPMGPEASPGGQVFAHEVARWGLLSAWAYRPGHPESGPGGDPRWTDTPWRDHTGAVVATRVGTTAASVAGRYGELSTLPATIAPDARAVDPREVARWAHLQGVTFNGAGPQGSFAGWERPFKQRGEVVCSMRQAGHPEVLAPNLAGLPTLPADIAPDARTIAPGPCLPVGTWVFIDPPYVGTTGYGHDLPRSEVVALARRWAEAGAGVMVTEAEAIPELVAEGWHAVGFDHGRVGQARTFSKQKTEVATMNRAPGRVDRLGVQTGMFGGGV